MEHLKNRTWYGIWVALGALLLGLLFALAIVVEPLLPKYAALPLVVVTTFSPPIFALMAMIGKRSDKKRCFYAGGCLICVMGLALGLHAAANSPQTKAREKIESEARELATSRRSDSISIREEYVGLWMVTGECKNFSKGDHSGIYHLIARSPQGSEHVVLLQLGCNNTGLSAHAVPGTRIRVMKQTVRAGKDWSGDGEQTLYLAQRCAEAVSWSEQ